MRACNGPRQTRPTVLPTWTPQNTPTQTKVWAMFRRLFGPITSSDTPGSQILPSADLFRPTIPYPKNGIGRLVDRRKIRNMPTAKNRRTGTQAAAIGGILAPAPRAMQILPAANNAINNKRPPATPPRAPRRENTTHIGLATRITTSAFQGRAKRYQN